MEVTLALEDFGTALAFVIGRSRALGDERSRRGVGQDQTPVEPGRVSGGDVGQLDSVGRLDCADNWPGHALTVPALREWAFTPIQP